MANKGRPGEAIGYSVMSSTMGGVLGWIVAVTCVPLIANIALHSEPADIALIAVAGLLLVSAFVRGSMVRGMIGAMTLHGLQPGVLLLQNNAELVPGILAAILVATLLMFCVGWLASSAFIKILTKDRALLFPFIMVFATIGAFAAENGTFPINVAALCGLAGFFLERRGFSVVPIVLGAVLGPVIEYNVRLGLAFSNGDWTTFYGTDSCRGQSDRWRGRPGP